MKIRKDSKIVVTGGTGFLGSHILRGLIEKGYSSIYALCRSSSSKDLISDISSRITWVEGDILDVESLSSLMSQAEYVIHSAAKVSYNPKDRKEVFDINIEGTANVVNACINARTKKLIFISSVAAIGRIKSGQVITEKSEWSNSKFNTNYGVAKHNAELEIWRGMGEGLDVGIINPSMILGPSFWGDSSTKVFTHVIDGGRFYPPGDNGFVDVRDVAELTITFLESEVKNERIIAVCDQMSYKDLFAKIASELKVRPPKIKIGKYQGAILWRILRFKQFLFGGDPPITSETVKITSGKFIYDNAKSRELFDFKYRAIDTSIAETVNKYLDSQTQKKSFAFFERIHK